MATLDINVRQANADFQAIKSSIVKNGVVVEDGTKTAEYAGKVDKVYEAGKKYFSDIYFTEDHKSWIYAFAGIRWVDEVYNPPRTMVTGVSNNLCNHMFGYSRITDTKVDIVVRSPSNSSVFGNSQLVTIRGLEVTEDVKYNTWFNGCSSLVNLTMKGTIGQNGFDVQWSTKLSHDSIVSIINALSATTTGLTVTLSLTAVNKAFETSEGANDGSTSDEWLALVATKENWTIALA